MKLINSVTDFFKYLSHARDEIKLITWSEPNELGKSTKVVLSTIFIFGLSTYVVDLFLKNVIDSITQLIRHFL